MRRMVTYRIAGEPAPEAKEAIIEKLLTAGLERAKLFDFTPRTKETA